VAAAARDGRGSRGDALRPDRVARQAEHGQQLARRQHGAQHARAVHADPVVGDVELPELPPPLQALGQSPGCPGGRSHSVIS
jgi:hypothetical protein